MSILRQWVKKEDPKPEEKKSGVKLHFKCPFFVWPSNKEEPCYVSKIELYEYPRYHIVADVVYVELDECIGILLPIEESEEELLKLFGREKK